MTPLGSPIGRLPVTLKKERVLEAYEGNRIVEYRTRNGEPYIAIWHDTELEEGVTRWLFVRSTDSELGRYLRGDRSLRQVITEALDGFVYVIDQCHGRPTTVALLFVEEITDLPDEDAFHDPGLRPPSENETQVFLIDGRWSAYDMSELERRYAQVSAFLAHFGEAGLFPNVPELPSGDPEEVLIEATEAMQQAPRGSLPPNAFAHYEYKGGWIQHSTYDRLLHTMPWGKQPTLTAVHYSSPGVMRFEVDPKLAALLRTALGHFVERHEDVTKRYDMLHVLLLEDNKARESAKTEGEPEDPKSIEQRQEAIAEASRQLAGVLGIANLDAIWKAAGNSLNVGHLLAGYYRKIDYLFRVDADKRARLV